MTAFAPLDYLHASGDKAYPVLILTWALACVAVAVIIIITVLVVLAVWRRPGISGGAPGRPLEVSRPRAGLGWIWTGVSLTVVVLLASIVWTVEVLGEVRAPHVPGALTIEVTGHQWWWEARYLSKNPAQVFRTANEIHIPTGQPVFVKLGSADVIHSFWVPALSGKTDTIPALTNETWLEARDPGVYSGQCTEYCGGQHAHMGFLIVAQTPADFAAWRARQLNPPAPPAGDRERVGAAYFQARCSSCHSLNGTDAGGAVGPTLSHLMERRTLAATALPNDPADLARWIADPQSVKPGSLMPRTAASKDELDDIRAYLESLK